MPQPVVESLDGTLLLGSETLGIEIRVKGEEMRFRDPATGCDVLSLREEHAARRAAEVEAEREAAARRAAEARAEHEAAARGAAEARVAELEALLREKRD